MQQKLKKLSSITAGSILLIILIVLITLYSTGVLFHRASDADYFNVATQVTELLTAAKPQNPEAVEEVMSEPEYKPVLFLSKAISETFNIPEQRLKHITVSRSLLQQVKNRQRPSSPTYSNLQQVLEKLKSSNNARVNLIRTNAGGGNNGAVSSGNSTNQTVPGNQAAQNSTNNTSNTASTTNTPIGNTANNIGSGGVLPIQSSTPTSLANTGNTPTSSSTNTASTTPNTSSGTSSRNNPNTVLPTIGGGSTGGTTAAVARGPCSGSQLIGCLNKNIEQNHAQFLTAQDAFTQQQNKSMMGNMATTLAFDTARDTYTADAKNLLKSYELAYGYYHQNQQLNTPAATTIKSNMNSLVNDTAITMTNFNTFRTVQSIRNFLKDPSQFSASDKFNLSLNELQTNFANNRASITTLLNNPNSFINSEPTLPQQIKDKDGSLDSAALQAAKNHTHDLYQTTLTAATDAVNNFVNSPTADQMIDYVNTLSEYQAAKDPFDAIPGITPPATGKPTDLNSDQAKAAAMSAFKDSQTSAGNTLSENQLLALNTYFNVNTNTPLGGLPVNTPVTSRSTSTPANSTLSAADYSTELEKMNKTLTSNYLGSGLVNNINTFLNTLKNTFNAVPGSNQSRTQYMRLQGLYALTHSLSGAPTNYPLDTLQSEFNTYKSEIDDKMSALKNTHFILSLPDHLADLFPNNPKYAGSTGNSNVQVTYQELLNKINADPQLQNQLTPYVNNSPVGSTLSNLISKLSPIKNTFDSLYTQSQDITFNIVPNGFNGFTPRVVLQYAPSSVAHLLGTRDSIMGRFSNIPGTSVYDDTIIPAIQNTVNTINTALNNNILNNITTTPPITTLPTDVKFPKSDTIINQLVDFTTHNSIFDDTRNYPTTLDNTIATTKKPPTQATTPQQRTTGAITPVLPTTQQQSNSNTSGLPTQGIVPSP